MEWTQHKLPFEEPFWSDCPRCGFHYDVREALMERVERIKAVLTHPRIVVLPESTLVFLRACPSVFLLGEQPVGTALLHKQTGICESGVHYQLQNLVRWNIVSKVPKVKDSRAARPYYLYLMLIRPLGYSEDSLKNLDRTSVTL